MTNTYCRVYDVETPDDGQYICPKHVEFFIKINLRNSASRWLLLWEYITMHGPLIVRFVGEYYVSDIGRRSKLELIINTF